MLIVQSYPDHRMDERLMNDLIKVMSIDDSSLSLRILSNIVNSQPDMKMVAVSVDPFEAESLIQKERPDVITLDVEMPKIDGLSFLKQLMKTNPVSVVMVSSLTEKGAETTLKALEYGAIDFVTKPRSDGISRQDFEQELISKIRIAYQAKQQDYKESFSQRNVSLETNKPVAVKKKAIKAIDLILIGSSTGGTEALRTILEQLPESTPPILITQHMPVGFTKKFADRLNVHSKMTVVEAQDGQLVKKGCVYIAPGGLHLAVGKNSLGYVCKVIDSEPINRHCPSVQCLFESALAFDVRSMMAIMLTGMGKDGAEAMAKLHGAGAFTICQDEKSCVVFGMPGAAIALGAADKITPLHNISAEIQTYANLSVFANNETFSS